MSERLLYRSGDGYVSYSGSPFALSPVYVVAAAARRLISAGHQIALPVGYDTDTLDQIAHLTGGYGKQVKMSHRQGGEIAEIARALECHPEASPAERVAAKYALSVIDRRPPDYLRRKPQ